MTYDWQLQFVADILQGLQVSSCVVSDPNQTIPSSIDQGLRALIFERDDYADLLQNSMHEAQHNTIYRFFDEYDCNYIFLRLPDEAGFFFIGPYLLQEPSLEKITEKMTALRLGRTQVKQIYRLYTTFPIAEDENILLCIAATLGKTLWGGDEKYQIEYVDYAIPDRSSPLPITSRDGRYAESSFSLAALEENYANERKLMEAVSQGKLHKVSAVAASVFNNGTEPRLSDSLRNRKNYLIILNTLLRKAAEYGGVHPLHIDRISSRFAIQIEQVHSLQSSLLLQEEMIRDYCLLVKRHSLQNYTHRKSPVLLPLIVLSSDLHLLLPSFLQSEQPLRNLHPSTLLHPQRLLQESRSRTQSLQTGLLPSATSLFALTYILSRKESLPCRL